VRIATFEVIPYSLAFREPYVTARGTLHNRESILLRVRDEDGLEGLGEAVPLSLRGGASIKQVATELDDWLGQAAALPDGDEEPPPLSSPARCALWSAGADLTGKREAIPAFATLPGVKASHAPTPIRCNATLVAGPPERVARDAAAWAADGFTTFKLKVGNGGEDVGQVRAVRETVGPGARMRVDANGAWTVDEAENVLSEMAGYELELAEQPVSTLEEMAELRGRTQVSLAADESVASPQEAARAREIEACEVATVKLSKVGGAAGAMAIEQILGVYLSSALDGPVGIAAAAHVAQGLASSELAHGLATQRLFVETIASAECELRDGDLHLPPGPGLGVVIDEAALERCRL